MNLRYYIYPFLSNFVIFTLKIIIFIEIVWREKKKSVFLQYKSIISYLFRKLNL